MELFRVLTVMAIVGIALGGCSNQASPSPEPGNVAATTDATRGDAHRECEPEFIAEYAFSGSDDSDLVGFSDNVFVGRVEKRIGTTEPKAGGQHAVLRGGPREREGEPRRDRDS